MAWRAWGGLGYAAGRGQLEVTWQARVTIAPMSNMGDGVLSKATAFVRRWLCVIALVASVTAL